MPAQPGPADLADRRSELALHRRRQIGEQVEFDVGVQASDRTGIAYFDTVTPACRWSIEETGVQLEEADLDVVERHTRTGPGYRPHGPIIARLLPRETTQ